MNKSEIPFLTATEISEQIRNRDVSPVEVTEAYLERIEALNPKLNSYITVMADEAIKRRRKRRRPLHRADILAPCTVCRWLLRTSFLRREFSRPPVPTC